MRKILCLLLATLLICLGSRADSQQRVATTTTTVTIGSTGVFQQALASSSRNGCTIQYTSANTGYVYFGVLANATTSNAFQLTVKGQAVNCEVAGIVLTDQISVSGTTGDTFVVTQQ